MDNIIINVDFKSPIISGTEMGGIKLKSHIKNFYNLIYTTPVFENGKDMEKYVLLYNSNQIAYEVRDTIRLVFNIFNGKLYKISALKNYKGCLEESIHVGMSIHKALSKKKDLIYDEIEELYFSNGVTIETDAYGKYIEAITVHIPELNSLSGKHSRIEDIERGNW